MGGICSPERSGGRGRDASVVMPLDAARSAFEWLVTGPSPVCLDGRLFAGMPDRAVPLDEVRARLLHRRCGQTTRDAVWAHLVLRSRTEGATWTVACVGMALPALTRLAARLCGRFAGDVCDIHAAVLAGFVAELERVDLRKPRIMLRLRWAAYRAGHATVREALDAPTPAGDGYRSAPPARPWGHPDFVLVRAVAENVISTADAELIGATRLEGVSLADLAARRGVSYEAVKKARQRAEHRLVAFLRQDGSEPASADLSGRVVDTVTVTAAGLDRAADVVSRDARDDGVQGCEGARLPSAMRSPTCLEES